MKILIIGSKGQLGYELIRQGQQKKIDIIGADLPELNIVDIRQVENIIKNTLPSIVINAAAYTQVDKAESEQELAFAVNRDGPANIAASCNSAKIPLIHISTDFVFDGKKKTPYVETDPIAPLSIYGKSKAEGEHAVILRHHAHIIVRTAWLYGIHGHNFVRTILRLGKEKETLRIVADQYGCPTNAADLAEALLIIADQISYGSDSPWGIYHYCGQGITTWHEFAQTIIKIASPYGGIRAKKIEAITTSEYPTPAKRPEFSALDCRKIQKTFGIENFRPWHERLKTTVEAIWRTRN